MQLDSIRDHIENILYQIELSLDLISAKPQYIINLISVLGQQVMKWLELQTQYSKVEIISSGLRVSDVKENTGGISKYFSSFPSFNNNKGVDNFNKSVR